MESDLISNKLLNCLSSTNPEVFDFLDENQEEKNKKETEKKVKELLDNLQILEKRDEALFQISLLEEKCEDLALYLFYSPCTMIIL